MEHFAEYIIAHDKSCLLEEAIQVGMRVEEENALDRRCLMLKSDYRIRNIQFSKMLICC